jgi:ABC-type lipoprotein release transport system permease subunit
MTFAAWNALLWFSVATYITLFAFGWLPGSPSERYDHPAVKSFRILGPLVTSSLMLATASLLACFFPARRATKVSPMTALRTE